MDQGRVERRVRDDSLAEIVRAHAQVVLGDDPVEERGRRGEVRVGLGEPLAREQLVEVGVRRLDALADDEGDLGLVDLGQGARHEVRGTAREEDARDEEPQPGADDADLMTEFHRPLVLLSRMAGALGGV